jgi:mRNA-degrading endonuclease RelE of RelBE toxin-antitoxin system
MIRLDPRKIEPDLLHNYFFRLAMFHLLDRAAEAFEQVGCPEDLHEVWEFVLWTATRDGRKDIAERLMKVRPDAATIEAKLDPGMRLLLAQDDPARYLELLNEVAMNALQTEDSTKLVNFAFGLLESRLSPLGIFAARSMIALVEQKDATFLFNQILEARDKLKLPPEDPYSDIYDKRVAEHEPEDAKDTGELRKAQQLLEAKAAEVLRLKTLLIGTQREIAKRERERHAPAPAATPATAPVPVDEAALSALRRKVDELKSALNERHTERNTLRRELEKAYTDLETLRLNAAPVNGKEESEANAREEALLLPEEHPTGNQPVRLIDFPRDFADALRRVPPSVARTTLSALGRIASGEAAAFIGSIRLKDCHGVMRRRIGEYRLLYRLSPERVQVIDLIPRCDLERRIKMFIGS